MKKPSSQCNVRLMRDDLCSDTLQARGPLPPRRKTAASGALHGRREYLVPVGAAEGEEDQEDVTQLVPVHYVLGSDRMYPREQPRARPPVQRMSGHPTGAFVEVHNSSFSLSHHVPLTGAILSCSPL